MFLFYYTALDFFLAMVYNAIKLTFCAFCGEYIMKVYNAGFNYRHTNDFKIERKNGSGDYLLLVVKSDAYFYTDGVNIRCIPDSVIIFSKGSPQIYGAVDNNYINDWIHFDLTEQEHKKISDLGIPFDTLLHVGSAITYSSFIKQIFNEKYSQNMHKDSSMQMYFELLIYKLSEALSQKKGHEHPLYHEFEALRNDIYLNPAKERNIDIISKQLGFSRSYVQHLYKSFFGVSLVNDITSSKIEYAKALLSATNMRIKSISAQCGYSNELHFMRVFKASLGITPSKYRNSFSVSKKEMINSYSDHRSLLEK